MLQNCNVYIPQGWLESDTEEGKNLDAIQVNDDFYVVLDVETRKVQNYLYKSWENELSEEIFWKCLKMTTDSYNSLFKCPFPAKEEDLGDDSAPRAVNTSVVNLFKHLGVDDAKWNKIRRLTYKEAFAIDSSELRMKVFAGVNVAEMINELGYEKIDVKGKPVKRLFYNEVTGQEESREYDAIYELLRVKISDLIGDEAQEEVYGHVVKCWCTSTNEEHYLWVEDQFATDALTAISSTCRLQKDVLEEGSIIELRRQGDTFYPKYTDDFDMKRLDPNAETVPLTADQYFSLLTAET